MWSLKNEALKYLRHDLTGLLEVMEKLSNDIYELEKLNITKTSTSSLAFKAITNYIKEGVLFKIKGRAHYIMR